MTSSTRSLKPIRSWQVPSLDPHPKFKSYDKEEIYRETGLSSRLEAIGPLSKYPGEQGSEVDNQDEIDIHYELESVKSMNQLCLYRCWSEYDSWEKVREQTLSDKDIATVDSFISRAWTGPIQTSRICTILWMIQEGRTQDLIHHWVLDQMIESVIESHIRKLCQNWYIGADELRYYIQHYKVPKNKQAKASSLTTKTTRQK